MKLTIEAGNRRARRGAVTAMAGAVVIGGLAVGLVASHGTVSAQSPSATATASAPAPPPPPPPPVPSRTATTAPTASATARVTATAVTTPVTVSPVGAQTPIAQSPKPVQPTVQQGTTATPALPNTGTGDVSQGGEPLLPFVAGGGLIALGLAAAGLQRTRRRP